MTTTKKNITYLLEQRHNCLRSIKIAREHSAALAVHVLPGTTKGSLEREYVEDQIRRIDQYVDELNRTVIALDEETRR